MAKKYKVALMCGHGRSVDGSWDSGCAYGGYTEAGLMLPITKAAVKYLRSYGVTVISDADKNNNKNMIADVRWANKEKCDLYVSIHCDYKKAPSGVMPLYVSTKGKKLAKRLNNAVKKGMGMKSRGVVRRTNLWELNGTDMVACILETGSIKADLKTLKNKADAYGKCIAKGICDYLGVSINKTVKAKKPVPSLTLTKTNQQVIDDAVRWAVWIANDSRFHYGHGTHAHHNGCHFCDTNKKFKKGHSIKEWEYTACCNPFVGSAWAHGGCVPVALKLCRDCKSWDFGTGKGSYATSSLFKAVGNARKISLKKGDVICTPSHVMLYIGDGKVVHAGYEDDNKVGSKKWNKSICVEKFTDTWHYRAGQTMRTYRFIGKVNAKMPIRYGECSYRVRQLQECLGIKADGLYGDSTLKAVKAFKKKCGLNSTGTVAEKTIEALKKLKAR